jgi:hypothetical protein
VIKILNQEFIILASRDIVSQGKDLGICSYLLQEIFYPQHQVFTFDKTTLLYDFRKAGFYPVFLYAKSNPCDHNFDL